MQHDSTQTQFNAAIYVRVSTTGQEEDGTSLTTQEDLCRAFATERGWSISDEQTYREVYSGIELWDRPQLTSLRAALRSKSVDVVVAYAIDRLSRDPVHLGLILTEADHHGVAVEFVTEPLDNTPEGQLIRFVRGYAAKIEHEKIRERAMRGKKARVQSGKMLAGPRPLYGYRWPDTSRTKLDIHPDTGVIVQRIFNEAVSGKPLRRIAIDLTAAGIPTPTGRSKAWSHTAVAGILKHPNYTGDAYAWAWRSIGDKSTNVFDSENALQLPAGTVPALVDAETWNEAQRILTRNQERARLNLSNHPIDDALLWGGFVRCGYCGRAMIVNRSRDRTPTYACTARSDPAHQCENHTIQTPKLDAAVWDRIEAILTRPEIVAAELERLRGDDPTESDLAAIDRSHADVKRRQARAARAITALDDPDASAPLVSELRTLGDRLKQLESERAAIVERKATWDTAQLQLDGLEAWCRTVADNLSELAYDEKRVALDALGVQVSVYRSDHDPRYVITATVPIDGVERVQNSEEFLRNAGVDYDRRDYFKESFTPVELAQLFASIGVSAQDVISTRSKVYQARRDEIAVMSESELVKTMTEEPTLIRRPIVVADSAHVIGSKKADLEAFASQAE